MKTNTVPSLACKGNGITLGLTNGNLYSGLIANGGTLLERTQAYGTFVGSSNAGSATFSSTVGITPDATKSGIITDTGTMSAVGSRAIIKY